MPASAQQLGDPLLGAAHLAPGQVLVQLLAEVARLVALGATPIEDMGGYWQMKDPAGQVFCVVGVQTGAEFERHATTWP